MLLRPYFGESKLTSSQKYLQSTVKYFEEILSQLHKIIDADHLQTFFHKQILTNIALKQHVMLKTCKNK